ncbi:MAG: SpoIIE family protein phosphatase [Gammaproteobacteria bacterium]|jgi:serine phosphatase RsbU (regulator of sigma subunit)|nr:SpoIIE family protein phosphatase [Gammaproteobacteria bacterium]
MESDFSQLLLIADERHVAQQMAAHYDHLEYQVKVAESPMHALHLLTDCPIHLILFFYDGKVPTHTALLQDIIDKSEEIPLVVITHVVTALDVTTLLRLGATAVFSLPLDSQTELDQCVARHVRHAKLFLDNLRYRQQLEQANIQLNESLAELERDQQAGRLMQQSLMPAERTQLDGLLIKRHMQSSLYLSGDFVDHVSLPDGRVLFYLADVSGHGASSAILTILLKFLTRRILSDEHVEGAAVIAIDGIMARLNQEILDSDVDKHLTMFMGVISSDRRSLSYCVGGHYPMPVLYQKSTLEYLPGLGSGFPLGLFEGAEYQQYQLSLAAEFDLLLCSDGVLEVLPNGSEVDQQTLFLDLLRSHGCNISGLISGLQLDKCQHVPDDIAVLSIAGSGNG